MKLKETQIHKNLGTIQYVNDEYEGKVYVYVHFTTGKTCWDYTLKGAKEMLEFEDKQFQEEKVAIDLLKRRGYKVFRQIA